MEIKYINIGILTWITFLPIIGMLVLMFLPKEKKGLVRWFALVATLLQVMLAVIIYIFFDREAAGVNNVATMQFVERFTWIDIKSVDWFGRIRIEYFLGIDGISVPMVLLTALISCIAVVSSWNIEKSVKGYFALLLLLDAGMMGVFVSLDFFLFYFFWEIMLLPMYFLIGIWGGPRREYAAIKFFIYTLFGSVLMLLVVIALYFSVSVPDPVTNELVHTFDMLSMMNPANYEANSLLVGFNTSWRYIAYVGLFIGFAIKVPIFPFHTWLPDAHVEAPTAISVILAGVLLKMGTYGLARFSLPIFPQAANQLTPILITLAVVGIIYGALVSMVQTDIKKLVAYSSVSHLGFVVLGIFAATEESLQGSILQMVNHGLSTGALFLLVGMLYDRKHSREISDFGGLAKSIPIFSTIFMIVTLSSIGLPGLNGFVGEFLILVGSFNSSFIPSKWFTIFATSGVILSAVYMLWMFQRVVFGKITSESNSKLNDLSKREIGLLIPIIIFIVWIGIYPSTFLKITTNSSKNIVTLMNKSIKNINPNQLSK